MFLKDTGADVTDEEFNTIILPFDNNIHKYLQQETIPSFCAFYIAEGFRTSSLFENSYSVYLNEALDLFNDFPKDLENIKASTTKLLKEIYKLKVVADNPLQLKEVEENDS